MSTLTITNNFTNSTTADAEQVDTNFSDVKSFVDSHLVHNHDALVVRHGVRLHKAISAVGSGSVTAITWGDEREDTDGYWSTGASVTIPAGLAGVYGLSFVTVATISSGRTFLEVFPTITSGLVDIPQEWRNYFEPAEDRAEVAVVTPLGVGDSFTCRVFQSTGSSVNFESFLSLYRISQ